jgi:hypothetical protein
MVLNVYRDNMTSKPGVLREHSARNLSMQLAPRPRPKSWIIWFSSIGILLPYTFGSTGKYVAALLLFPASVAFFSRVLRGQRFLMACDVFAWVVALGMVVVHIGTSELQPFSADAISFIGAYMAARAFYFGEASVEQFLRAIGVIAVVLIALGVWDVAAGRHVTDDFLRSIFQTDKPLAYVAHLGVYRELFGFTILRAQSVFGHAILFGAFCSIVGTLFLYLTKDMVHKVFYVGACVVGIILSVSSAAISGFIIGAATYCYDRAMEKFLWRWKASWLVLAGLACVLFAASNHPIGWLVSHLTLDPASGYYRISLWNHAFEYIAMSPFTGGVDASSDEYINNSTDSIWLVYALSCGLPLVLFLLLANITACGGFGARKRARLISMRLRRMRTAFSVVLVLFVFMGLTTHFWDAMWMLWGLCIGVRASLEEYCFAAAIRSDNSTGREAKDFRSPISSARSSTLAATTKATLKSDTLPR